MILKTGILFDLDGTLLDSAPDLTAAANRLFRSHGKQEVPLETLRPIAGEGTVMFIEQGFGYRPQQEQYEQLKRELIQHYIDVDHEGSVLFPGIEPLLENLNKFSIPWGIVTNKYAHLTFPVLKKFPILGTNQALVCADTLSKAKPHPEPLLYACQQLQIDPLQSFYVGDHERDMQAAKAAGMISIAALYGYIADPKQTLAWGASEYVTSVEILTELINNYFLK